MSFNGLSHGDQKLTRRGTKYPANQNHFQCCCESTLNGQHKLLQVKPQSKLLTGAPEASRAHGHFGAGHSITRQPSN